MANNTRIVGLMLIVGLLSMLSIPSTTAQKTNFLLGVAVLDDLDSMSNKEGRVTFAGASVDNFKVGGELSVNSGVVIAGPADQSVDTARHMDVTVKSVNVTAGKNFTIAAQDGSVAFKSVVASFKAGKGISSTSDDVSILSQSFSSISGRATTMTGDKVELESVQDFVSSVTGGTTVNAASSVTIGGESSNIAGSGPLSFTSTRSAVEIDAATQFAINVGGSITATAQSDVSITSSHNSVAFQTAVGQFSASGANIDIDGLDGVDISSSNQMTIEAARDLNVEGDEIRITSLGSVAFVSKDQNSDVVVNAAGDVRFSGASFSLNSNNTRVEGATTVRFISTKPFVQSSEQSLDLGSPTASGLAINGGSTTKFSSNHGPVDLIAKQGDIKFTVTDAKATSTVALTADGLDDVVKLATDSGDIVADIVDTLLFQAPRIRLNAGGASTMDIIAHNKINFKADFISQTAPSATWISENTISVASAATTLRSNTGKIELTSHRDILGTAAQNVQFTALDEFKATASSRVKMLSQTTLDIKSTDGSDITFTSAEDFIVSAPANELKYQTAGDMVTQADGSLIYDGSSLASQTTGPDTMIAKRNLALNATSSDLTFTGNGAADSTITATAEWNLLSEGDMLVKGQPLTIISGATTTHTATDQQGLIKSQNLLKINGDGIQGFSGLRIDAAQNIETTAQNDYKMAANAKTGNKISFAVQGAHNKFTATKQMTLQGGQFTAQANGAVTVTANGANGITVDTLKEGLIAIAVGSDLLVESTTADFKIVATDTEVSAGTQLTTDITGKISVDSVGAGNDITTTSKTNTEITVPQQPYTIKAPAGTFRARSATNTIFHGANTNLAAGKQMDVISDANLLIQTIEGTDPDSMIIKTANFNAIGAELVHFNSENDNVKFTSTEKTKIISKTTAMVYGAKLTVESTTKNVEFVAEKTFFMQGNNFVVTAKDPVSWDVDGGVVGFSIEQLVSITADETLTFENTSPALGNQNDEDLVIKTTGATMVTAKKDLVFTSTGVDALDDNGIEVDVGAAATFTTTVGKLDIIGDNGVQFTDTASFLAKSKGLMKFDTRNGGLIVDAYNPNADNVVLQTVTDTDSGNILIQALLADVHVFSGQETRFVATAGAVNFRGNTGWNAQSFDMASVTSSEGDVTVTGAKGVHVTGGSASNLNAPGTFSSTQNIEFTTQEQIRIHSFGRVTATDDIGIKFFTDIANDGGLLISAAAPKGIEVNAAGSFTLSNVDSANTPTMMLTAQAGDVNFKAENGRLSATAVQGDMSFTGTPQPVRVLAGGLDGRVALDTVKTFLVQAATNLNIDTAEDILSQSVTENTVTATAGNIRLRSLSKTGHIATTSGGKINVLAEVAGTQPIKVTGHSIDILSKQTAYDTAFFTVGTPNTLTNPRIQLRAGGSQNVASVGLQVTSVGDIAFTTLEESILVDIGEKMTLNGQTGVTLVSHETVTLAAHSHRVGVVDEGVMELKTNEGSGTLRGKIETQFRGDGMTFSSTAQNLHIEALPNVQGNDIELDARQDVTLQADQQSVDTLLTGHADIDSATTSVLGKNGLKLQSGTSFMVDADQQIIFNNLAGSLTFATDNNNGAKMEFNVRGEDSDIRLRSARNILATINDDITLQAQTLDASATAGLKFDSSQGDIVYRASDLVHWKSSALTATATRDVDIASTEPLSTVRVHSGALTKIDAAAGETVVENIPGQKGSIIATANKAVAFTGLNMNIDSHADTLFAQNGVATGAVGLQSAGFTSITEGYLDIFVDGVNAATVSSIASNALTLRSETGRVEFDSSNQFTTTVGTTLTLQADDGFRSSVVGGNFTTDQLKLTSTAATSHLVDNGNYNINGFEGVGFTANGPYTAESGNGQITATTTHTGGDIAFTSVGNTVVDASTGITMSAPGTEQNYGAIRLTTKANMKISSLGDPFGDVKITGTGDVAVEGKQDVKLISKLAWTATATGGADIIAQGGDDYSILADASASVRFSSKDLGTGFVRFSAGNGLIDVDSERIIVQNDDEGIDFAATGTLEISNVRQLGLTGIDFTAVESIHIQAIKDDVNITANDIRFGTLSQGALTIESSGSASDNTVEITGTGKTVGKVAAYTIKSQNGGDVQMTAVCPDQVKVGFLPCGVALSSTDLLLQSSQHVTFEAASIVGDFGKALIIDAPLGHVQFNANKNAQFPNIQTSTTPAGADLHAVFFGDNTHFLQIPDRGLQQDGGDCPYNRELAIAESPSDGQVGLCICEDHIWSCSYD